MKKGWLVTGFFCQGYGGFDGKTAVPEGFFGTFWHEGHDEANLFVGRMTDNFGKSELVDLDFLDSTEIYFRKRYLTKSGEPALRDEVVYRLRKEATGPWWSGEYVVDSKPNPFKGPARCTIIQVPLEPIEADLAKFAKDHGFSAPRHIEV